MPVDLLVQACPYLALLASQGLALAVVRWAAGPLLPIREATGAVPLGSSDEREWMR